MPRTFEQFAVEAGSHLEVVSSSAPDAELKAHNVVIITPDEAEARRAIVALEGLEDEQSAINLVALSARPRHEPVDVQEPQVDPERVTGYVARRSLKGAVVGGILGALLVAGIVALITDGWAPIIAGALGGVAFFAVYGAIVRSFAGMGGSSSYRASFVDPHVTDVVLAGYLTDDPERAREARARLDRHDLNAKVVTVDASGRAR